MIVNQEFKEDHSLESSIEVLPEEEMRELVKLDSPVSEEVKEFLLSLEKSVDPEEKVRKAIDFMRVRLSGSAPPKFREFWEVRKICLPLFKENISSKSRPDLWQQYIDLSVEARRLKSILDEQSAFAFEQIDLAVQSLVCDLDSYKEKLSLMPNLEICTGASFLNGLQESYNQTQKQLCLLNSLAAKVNGLRKEVIKTDMRIRSKNKLFEKLSQCGDRIFPERKELIKKMSLDFSKDVERFVEKFFGQEVDSSISLHFLREEIKGLQSLAKQLTLNTQSFTETRLALSSCWDKLKNWDKEKKKEIAQKKVLQKQDYEEASLKVKELQEFCKDLTSLELIEEKCSETIQFLKGLKDLGWGEFRQLAEMVRSVKSPLLEKLNMEKIEAENQERQLEVARLEKLQILKGSLLSAIESSDQVSLEEMLAQKNSLEEMYKELGTSKAEKMWIDRLFKQLKDRILEVKSSRLLSLSHSDQEKYLELKNLIEEKKERRQEVKAQLELYRKALGGSGFDFEKAMIYRELLEVEKNNLEKMNLAIVELEKKMDRMQG